MCYPQYVQEVYEFVYTFLCYTRERGRLLEQFTLLLCNPIKFHQVSLPWHQLGRKILVRLSSIAGSYHVITNRLLTLYFVYSLYNLRFRLWRRQIMLHVQRYNAIIIFLTALQTVRSSGIVGLCICIKNFLSLQCNCVCGPLVFFILLCLSVHLLPLYSCVCPLAFFILLCLSTCFLYTLVSVHCFLITLVSVHLLSLYSCVCPLASLYSCVCPHCFLYYSCVCPLAFFILLCLSTCFLYTLVSVHLLSYTLVSVHLLSYTLVSVHLLSLYSCVCPLAFFILLCLFTCFLYTLVSVHLLSLYSCVCPLAFFILLCLSTCFLYTLVSVHLLSYTLVSVHLLSLYSCVCPLAFFILLCLSTCFLYTLVSMSTCFLKNPCVYAASTCFS